MCLYLAWGRWRLPLFIVWKWGVLQHSQTFLFLFPLSTSWRGQIKYVCVRCAHKWYYSCLSKFEWMQGKIKQNELNRLVQHYNIVGLTWWCWKSSLVVIRWKDFGSVLNPSRWKIFEHVWMLLCRFQAQNFGTETGESKTTLLFHSDGGWTPIPTSQRHSVNLNRLTWPWVLCEHMYTCMDICMQCVCLSTAEKIHFWLKNVATAQPLKYHIIQSLTATHSHSVPHYPQLVWPKSSISYK